jgi:hypothetical protein
LPLIQEHYLQAIAAGNFSFGVSVGMLGLVSGALVLIAIAFAGYRKPTRPLSRPWQAALIGLRSATLLLLGFSLLEPGVLVSEVVPQETYLAVLVDDSQSMGIRDREHWPSRQEQSVELLYGGGKIVERLSEHFQVRSYRFSDIAQRLAGPEALTEAGTHSALGASIQQVMSELAGFPLAGMVVVSDGADNGDIDPLHSAQASEDKKIPLYTVAIGAKEIEKDLNLLSVSVAKSQLLDSIYHVRVTLAQQGYQGQRAKLTVSEVQYGKSQTRVGQTRAGQTRAGQTRAGQTGAGQTGAGQAGADQTGAGQTRAGSSRAGPVQPGRDQGTREPPVLVAEQSIGLPDDGNPKRYSLELSPKEEAILVYNLHVEQKPGEIIQQNNDYTFFIDNRKKPALDVLYVEGQPRKDYKFIRRAIDNDRSLRLVTYLQTGPRKFLRQGIESPQELGQGFPSDAQSLFAYEAIVFGAVDKTLLNDSQLRLLRDFVARRGGGFMVVGGLEESFIDSPLADVLPVEMIPESRLPSYLQGGPRRGDHPAGGEYAARLTGDGQHSAILRLAPQPGQNRERWQKLPNLQGVYVSGRAKPGAAVLLEHPALTVDNIPLPILTTQRYGGGRSMVLATASSWRWQMLMPHEDESHAHLWRQMLRWLAADSPRRLTLALAQDSHHPGDTVEVSAHLLNEQFNADNNSLLWLQVKNPAGEVAELPMTRQMDKDGAYTRSFTVDREGVYDLTVAANSDVDGELQAGTPLIVTPPRLEFLRAGMDEGLMRRLAASTGGRFYTAKNARQLVDDVTFNPNAYSKSSVHTLWDEPLFLCLLVALLCLEWLARRYKGLS